MFTYYNLNLGICEVMYMVHERGYTDNLHIYTYHNKVSAYLTFYSMLW
jgi:hypothetical protein